MLSPGREQHWLGLSRPFDLATRKRRDAIILSRILENVWIRRIILKEAGLIEGFPSLVEHDSVRPFQQDWVVS